MYKSLINTTSASSPALAFPSADSISSAGSPSVPPSPQRSKALVSFRRISLPTAPSLLNRHSSASLASLTSFPEEGSVEQHGSPSSTSGKAISRRSSQSPFSHSYLKKMYKRRDSQNLDEGKLVRRRKIILEFYETERAYVQGLDLIYAVSHV